MCDDEKNNQQDNNNDDEKNNEDIKINPEWMMYLEKGAKIKGDKKLKHEEKEKNS